MDMQAKTECIPSADHVHPRWVWSQTWCTIFSSFCCYDSNVRKINVALWYTIENQLWNKCTV